MARVQEVHVDMLPGTATTSIKGVQAYRPNPAPSMPAAPIAPNDALPTMSQASPFEGALVFEGPAVVLKRWRVGLTARWGSGRLAVSAEAGALTLVAETSTLQLVAAMVGACAHQLCMQPCRAGRPLVRREMLCCDSANCNICTLIMYCTSLFDTIICVAVVSLCVTVCHCCISLCVTVSLTPSSPIP